MTQLCVVKRCVDDFIGRDDLGVAFAAMEGRTLRATYQPIFAASKSGALTFRGLRAGVENALDRQALDTDLLAAAAPLSLMNYGNTTSRAVELYLDQMIAGAWDGSGLADYLDEGGSAPRRVYLEAGAQATAPTRGMHVFRSALAYTRDDCWLDERITRHRPSFVRMEGAWLAELSENHSTRALLTTLVGMLRQRGIKTLFEGLDSDRLVSFAIDCGADRLQGDALCPVFSAGENVERHVVGLGANVVSVAFGHRGRS